MQYYRVIPDIKRTRMLACPAYRSWLLQAIGIRAENEAISAPMFPQHKIHVSWLADDDKRANKKLFHNRVSFGVVPGRQATMS
jgi:hypothetical protein